MLVQLLKLQDEVSIELDVKDRDFQALQDWHQLKSFRGTVNAQ